MADPTLDDVIKEITDITEAAKNGTLIDKEALAAALEDQVKAMVDAQVKEKLDSRPVRRVPVNLIGSDGTKITSSNRYHKALAAFEADGHAQWGNLKALPVDLWLAHQLIAKAHHYNPGQVRPPSDDLQAAIKALTSTGSGTGDEYVPTDMADSVWMDMFLSARVAGTLMNVNMPTDPFDLPLGLGAVTWRKGTQNTATTHSDPATAKSTLTTTEQVTEQRWSYTLDEDSVVAIMPLLRAELTRSGGEQIDDFVLNADATNAATGNINLDDADPDDASWYLSDGQDGIRHQWLVDNTAQQINAGGALVDADITGALTLMGKYAADPRRVVMAMDVQSYLNGMLATGSGAPGEYVITLDKLGTEATVITGMLAMYRGIPLLASSQHRLAQDDGKLNAASNTKGSITLYNRDMWKVGFRRQLLIEVDRLIQNRQLVMVSSFRVAVAARGTRSTNTHTAGIRNITV
jgi:HK97 family phage major capsid protein